MDLTGWLRRRAVPCPLLVTARGGARVRLAVERQAREWGWSLAGAPAEADLLVVCGDPDPELRDAVARVWPTLPSPRAQVEIRDAAEVATELERARDRLADAAAQRADLTARGTAGVGDSGPGQDDHAMAADSAHAGHGAQSDDAHDMSAMGGGHDMSAMGGGHDMSAMGGGHDMSAMGGGHDMHMMHGGEVAGLPMADRAPDRDGLTLDQLHVTLGPVLPDWPAGLRVRVTLQGDVVQAAEVEVLGHAEPQGSPWDATPRPAALDSLSRLLSVCGSDDGARCARRLRDELLGGTADEAELRRFGRRLLRSRSLRWATDGVGRLDESFGELAGDATRRWRHWLDLAEDPSAQPPDRARRARVALEVLPRLLEGQELAAARVVVASLDPDLDALMPDPDPDPDPDPGAA